MDCFDEKRITEIRREEKLGVRSPKNGKS